MDRRQCLCAALSSLLVCGAIAQSRYRPGGQTGGQQDFNSPGGLSEGESAAPATLALHAVSASDLNIFVS